ncbi:hypothetical protein [Streptomyces sp. NBC_01233]|uniref:hypothetical protein n=1 Tax=Streptomyces sp. NBC_01233 TaxID=2903787 RepID=UPI002E1263FF|nr:hypothetical protein OG332_47440 [Streptomyces sp. NBC_01233]
MKLWPFKTIRADRHDKLVAAEGALTVALAETVAMEKARDTALSARDDALIALELIQLELEGKGRELESLERLLDQAAHGVGSIHVLLNDGEAISAHRTKDGAKAAARLRYGVSEDGWSQGEGRPPTDGQVISTIPLAADTADTDTKAATA